jgi:hypothetical protein
MTGRMSMDQAKTIKQKRELARELGMLLDCGVLLSYVLTDVCISIEDVQQFEKAVLDRSSRSRSQTTAKMAVEDGSEKDKGTDSEEDEDESYAPKKQPVSSYVLIHRDASIMNLRNTFRPMQGKVLWLFCKINLMKNDTLASHLVQSLLIHYLVLCQLSICRKYSYMNILNSRINLYL